MYFTKIKDFKIGRKYNEDTGEPYVVLFFRAGGNFSENYIYLSDEQLLELMHQAGKFVQEQGIG